jgi:hypothetical protein
MSIIGEAVWPKLTAEINSRKIAGESSFDMGLPPKLYKEIEGHKNA